MINIDDNTSEIINAAAYKLDSLIMNFSDGRTMNIVNITDEIIITESIYDISLMCKLRIVDSMNMFEEFKINGTEFFNLIFLRKEPDPENEGQFKEVEHKKDFYIIEMPIFTKKDTHTQIYEFKCVSKHAYINIYKKLNRYFKENPIKLIQGILKDDLFYTDEIQVTSLATRMIEGIYPNLKPFAAIKWLMERSWDSNNAPFYCYETFKDGIKIESLSDCYNKEIYETYKEELFWSERPQSDEAILEHKRKIVQFEIAGSLSKGMDALQGSFSSTDLVLDMNTASMKKVQFNHNDKFKDMVKLGEFPFYPTKTPIVDIEKPLQEIYESKFNYYFENSLSGDYYNKEIINKTIKDSYESNMDNFNCQMTIAGDMDLESGNLVEVEIAKSIPPEFLDDLKESKETKLKSNLENKFKDYHLSGKYLVTGIVHNFGKEYYCRLRLKRDSSNYDLNAEEVSQNDK